jgi:hypothetical protein
MTADQVSGVIAVIVPDPVNPSLHAQVKVVSLTSVTVKVGIALTFCIDAMKPVETSTTIAKYLGRGISV